MLNISENSIRERSSLESLSSFAKNDLPAANRLLSWWLTGFMLLTIIVFFLPWTQNIQMKGTVTTLLPEQRPQDVNSAIAGRIEQWYVREGDIVEEGDTLVFLSEIKAEYFDPQLVDRTGAQINAKKGSIESYALKAGALLDQKVALESEWQLKKQQLENKIQQTELKQESFKAELKQAEVDLDIASFQYRRTDTLFQKGIKSLSELEAKKLKVQQTQAKLITTTNKLQESSNEIRIAQLQFEAVDNEYANKIAKTQSDRFATLSTLYDAEGGLQKLENQYANYSRRSELYYILAPQSGFITKAIRSGIGEVIKEGETLMTVVPLERELAVEMYVKPMDLPLLNYGQEVRLIFDGWQAFIISGWSNLSFGTYEGMITAIDNIPNEKSQYRILIRSNDPEKPFPELLRVGAGAQGIAMLTEVPVWYEVWRQLNGFPADFYEEDIEKLDDKFKPPVKAVAK